MKNSIGKYFAEKRKLSKISHLINFEILENYYIYEHSEISLRLINSLSYRTKLIGFVLLKTLLRFGDLHQFPLTKAVFSEGFYLQQSKTAKPVTNEFKIILPSLRYSLATCDYFYDIINYKMLSADIRKFIRGYDYFNNISYKHSCHIFRHLEASYMYSKGIPINLISKRLGDDEKTIKNYYIHKELLRIF